MPSAPTPFSGERLRWLLCILALCCWPAHAQDDTTKPPPFEATNLITAEADRFCTKTRDPWYGFVSSTKHPTTFALWGAYDIALTTDDGKTWHLAKFPRTGTNPDDPENETIKIASAAILPDGSLFVLFRHWQAALRTPAGDWLYFEAKPALPPDGKAEWAYGDLGPRRDQLFLTDEPKHGSTSHIYTSKDKGRSWSVVNLFQKAPLIDHDNHNYYNRAHVYISQTNTISAIQSLTYESCNGGTALDGISTEKISAKNKRTDTFIDATKDISFDEIDKLALHCAYDPHLGHKGEIYSFQECNSSREEDRRIYLLQPNGYRKYKLVRVQGEHWPEDIYNLPHDVIRTNDLSTFAWTGQQLFTLTGDQASLVADTPEWTDAESQFSTDNLGRAWLWDNFNIWRFDPAAPTPQTLLTCTP